MRTSGRSSTNRRPSRVADEVLRTLLANGGPYVNQLTAEQLREGPGKLWHANPGEKRIPFWSQIHEGTPFPSQSLPTQST